MRPPQPGHRSPPTLVDDAMREIFLRVPLDDPATLARASAVCTAWRGIISDADFGRDYRAFHGAAPPVLGFVYNYFPYDTSHFISTTASFRRSPARHDRHDWCALDSRHGLVLFHTHHDSREIRDLAVCDLVTHDRWAVPAHPSPEWSGVVQYGWKAAVLCVRVDRCNCSEGAFRVALVGSTGTAILAAVYSSEAGEWSDTVSTEVYMGFSHTWRSAIVGNKLYLPSGGSSKIAEYDMGAQKLAVIRGPLPLSDLLVGAEDGMLLFAAVFDTVLCLWSVPQWSLVLAMVPHLAGPSTSSRCSLLLPSVLQCRWLVWCRWRHLPEFT